jgi:hypothetical protein
MFWHLWSDLQCKRIFREYASSVCRITKTYYSDKLTTLGYKPWDIYSQAYILAVVEQGNVPAREYTEHFTGCKCAAAPISAWQTLGYSAEILWIITTTILTWGNGYYYYSGKLFATINLRKDLCSQDCIMALIAMVGPASSRAREHSKPYACLAGSWLQCAYILNGSWVFEQVKN